MSENKKEEWSGGVGGKPLLDTVTTGGVHHSVWGDKKHKGTGLASVRCLTLP